MSFWDTVMGHRLAETLNNCLPSLVESMEKKQYVRNVGVPEISNIDKIIEKEIEKGAKLCHSIALPNGDGFVLVFEK